MISEVRITFSDGDGFDEILTIDEDGHLTATSSEGNAMFNQDELEFGIEISRKVEAYNEND